MRIIAGSLGGRRIQASPGLETRPTAERVREALFSRIDSRYGLEGACVLDLFAGTGALGIEAMSRGARRVVFVEKARKAVAALENNLRALGLDTSCTIVSADVFAALSKLARAGERFDGALVDPPYGMGLAERALGSPALAEVLRPGGWLTLESSRAETTAQSCGRLVKVREDCYGDTKVALYEAAGAPNADAAVRGTDEEAR